MNASGASSLVSQHKLFGCHWHRALCGDPSATSPDSPLKGLSTSPSQAVHVGSRGIKPDSRSTMKAHKGPNRAWLLGTTIPDTIDADFGLSPSLTDMFLNLSEFLSVTKRVEPTLVKSFQPQAHSQFQNAWQQIVRAAVISWKASGKQRNSQEGPQRPWVPFDNCICRGHGCLQHSICRTPYMEGRKLPVRSIPSLDSCVVSQDYTDK